MHMTLRIIMPKDDAYPTLDKAAPLKNGMAEDFRMSIESYRDLKLCEHPWSWGAESISVTLGVLDWSKTYAHRRAPAIRQGLARYSPGGADNIVSRVPLNGTGIFSSSAAGKARREYRRERREKLCCKHPPVGCWDNIERYVEDGVGFEVSWRCESKERMRQRCCMWKNVSAQSSECRKES